MNLDLKSEKDYVWNQERMKDLNSLYDWNFLLVLIRCSLFGYEK